MSKEIWAKRYRLMLNGKCIDDFSSSSLWTYGEKPDDSVKSEWTDFNKFFVSFYLGGAKFAKRSCIGKRKIILDVGDEEITKDNFSKAELAEVWVKVSENISVGDLMDRLNIVDFMEYCRDKGFLSLAVGDEICAGINTEVR